MFGTVARLKMRPGALPLLMAWADALKPDNAPDSPRMRASYRANAALLGQHEWYLRMRSVLEEDPEWIDGDITMHKSSGEAHPSEA